MPKVGNDKHTWQAVKQIATFILICGFENLLA